MYFYHTTFAALQGMHVVGLLTDESDPAVSVMKVEHAPTESYADVGGLDQQIQVGMRELPHMSIGGMHRLNMFVSHSAGDQGGCGAAVDPSRAL